MSKKDYKKFALLIIERKLQRTNWAGEIFMLANDMAKIFQADNPKFNRERFLVACGVKNGYN